MYFKLKYGHDKFIWKVLKINIYFGLGNPKNQLNMILQKTGCNIFNLCQKQ